MELLLELGFCLRGSCGQGRVLVLVLEVGSVPEVIAPRSEQRRLACSSNSGIPRASTLRGAVRVVLSRGDGEGARREPKQRVGQRPDRSQRSSHSSMTSLCVSGRGN